VSRRAHWAWLAPAAAVAAADLFTKGRFAYESGEARPVWGEFLRFRPVYNEGGIWSLPISSALLTAATALAVPAIALWLLLPRGARAGESAGKALLLGGAAGNLYDRLAHGGRVRDFIDVLVPVVNYRWPTFNVADMAIVCGIGLLLVTGFRGRRAGKAAPA
jgi:signal peptidase II